MHYIYIKIGKQKETLLLDTDIADKKSTMNLRIHHLIIAIQTLSIIFLNRSSNPTQYISRLSYKVYRPDLVDLEYYRKDISIMI